MRSFRARGPLLTGRFCGDRGAAARAQAAGERPALTTAAATTPAVFVHCGVDYAILGVGSPARFEQIKGRLLRSAAARAEGARC